jgi:hypothetical protein
LVELPEFGDQETSEAVSMGDSGEACLLEGRGVVGELRGAESGEDAKGEIESADKDLRWKAHQTARDLEVGDQPEGSGRECWRDAVNEGIEIGLGEAVQEEVRDDEIVGRIERTGEGVGLMGVEARGRVRGHSFAAFAEEFEHGCAGVNRIGVETRILSEELGEKAAVAVAEDEGSLALEEAGEVVEAALLEGAAEGDVFEPAIRASDGVEVGLAARHRGRRGSRRSGVMRARSARLRRVRRAV